MKKILIGLAISILLIKASDASCAEWKRLEEECASYCFKAVRPILEHTKSLQQQVDDFQQKPAAPIKLDELQNTVLEKLINLEKKVDQKLETQHNMNTLALQKLVDLNTQQNADYLLKFESIFQKLEQISSFQGKSDNEIKLIKAKIAHLQETTDSLGKKWHEKLENQHKSIEFRLQEQYSDFIAKVQNTENLLRVKSASYEKNLVDQFKSIEHATHQQVQSLRKQTSDSQLQLEDIKNLIQLKTENLANRFDSQSKVIETLVQKQVSSLTSEYSKQLKDKFDSLNRNILTESKDIKAQMNVRLSSENSKIETKLNEIRKLYEVRKVMVKKPFRKIGSKYYFIENSEKINWFAAVHKCLEFGGHLASIQNVSEFNMLKALLKSHNDYWIDVNDLSTEGVFLSATTGLRATYLNWHSGNPNNFMNVEHCGALWFYNNRHQMNDVSCKAAKLFICESENVN